MHLMNNKENIHKLFSPIYISLSAKPYKFGWSQSKMQSNYIVKHIYASPFISVFLHKYLTFNSSTQFLFKREKEII